MRKTLLALSLMIFVSGAAAQDEDYPWKIPTAEDYPALVQTAATCNGFTPRNWTVMASAEGDLNKDGRPDCVLVLKGTDRRFIYKNDGLGSEEFDTNPRVLAVAFADAKGGFRLHVQNNSFIVMSDSPTMTEPFQDVSIKRGVLTFIFEEFYSAGSWSMSNRTYKFRYQNGEMTLIGVDKTSVQRNTGDIETRSYNLSTQRMTIEVGNISDDGQGKITRKAIRVRPLPTLRNVKPMFTWTIEKDVVL
ncbi:MAG: VCBS repeat-containing protein [Acidobacteria bacterium]|nr:VCBS repeat-containing protein [Acidobacteriota bacterium]